MLKSFWSEGIVLRVLDRWPAFCTESLELVKRHYPHPCDGVLAMTIFLCQLYKHSSRDVEQTKLAIVSTIEMDAQLPNTEVKNVAQA